jgi:hypothetical protein
VLTRLLLSEYSTDVNWIMHIEGIDLQKTKLSPPSFYKDKKRTEQLKFSHSCVCAGRNVIILLLTFSVR